MPRTHGLRELLGLLAAALEELGRGDPSLPAELPRRHRDSLRLLEESYLASRYLARRYGPEDSLACVAAMEHILRALEELEAYVFGGPPGGQEA